MIDIAQEGLDRQPGWLPALGRERNLCLGMDVDVATPGRVAIGDPVVVVDMEH